MKNNETNIFNVDENGVLTGLCGVLNIPEGVTKIATTLLALRRNAILLPR